MPDDVRTVEVAIPVEAGVAPAQADEATRARIGRLVSRMLRSSGVEAIVSSYEDLLALHPWHGVRIVRPAEYLAGAGGSG